MGLLDWLIGRLTGRRAAGVKPRQDGRRSGPLRQVNRTVTGVGQVDQLVMGVDIGTSLSKVVVLVESRRIAVRFDEPGSENPYLLPTALSVMPDGECRLGVHDGARRCYDDIKRPLIDGSTDQGVQLPLIAFMALLFRRVKQLIAESEGRLLTKDPAWLVNLGVPTESYGGGSSGETELVEAYGHSARTAWSLMEQMSPEGNERRLTLADVREAMQGGVEKDDRIDVFPELVAQVVSYVTSKKRQDGVHVLVDVGSGTLDVTVFYVHSTNLDSETVPVYARTVQPLGTRYLMDDIGKCTSHDLELSPFKHLPTEMQIAEIIGVPREMLGRIVKPFRNRVVCTVGEPIRNAGNIYNSLEWPGRMFLVGGGAYVALYKGVADEFAQKDQWENFAFGVRLVPLPRPNDLVAPGIDESRWHRLAVAYGLASDPLDIRKIIPPEDIRPDPPSEWKPPDNPPSWTGNW